MKKTLTSVTNNLSQFPLVIMAIRGRPGSDSPSRSTLSSFFLFDFQQVLLVRFHLYTEFYTDCLPSNREIEHYVSTHSITCSTSKMKKILQATNIVHRLHYMVENSCKSFPRSERSRHCSEEGLYCSLIGMRGCEYSFSRSICNPCAIPSSATVC